jgi:hypothetical protein
MKFNTAGPDHAANQIATLRNLLQHLEQAEHPSDFALVKQVLLSRIADLEEEVALAPTTSSRP